MLRRFGSARAALEVLPRLARRGERSQTVVGVTRAAAEAELVALHRIGAKLVCWGEPGYPSALAAIEDAPPILTVLGDAESMRRPMIAVVGARNASANGRRVARELAAALAKLEELGFVRKAGDEPPMWEIRRILKARLPVAELENLKARMLQAARSVPGVRVFVEGEGRNRRLVFAPVKPAPMPKRSALPQDDDELEA